MGHLVNPLSFRLGITTFWKANSLNHFYNNYNYSLLYFFDKVLHSFLEWLFNYRWVAGFFFRIFKYGLKKKLKAKRRIKKKIFCRRITLKNLYKLSSLFWGRVLCFNSLFKYNLFKRKLRLDNQLDFKRGLHKMPRKIKNLVLQNNFRFQFKGKKGAFNSKNKKEGFMSNRFTFSGHLSNKHNTKSLKWNKIESKGKGAFFNKKRRFKFRKFAGVRGKRHFKYMSKKTRRLRQIQALKKARTLFFMLVLHKRKIERIRKLKNRKLTLADKQFIFRRFQRKNFSRTQRYLILMWRFPKNVFNKSYFINNFYRKLFCYKKTKRYAMRVKKYRINFKLKTKYYISRLHRLGVRCKKKRIQRLFKLKKTVIKSVIDKSLTKPKLTKMKNVSLITNNKNKNKPNLESLNKNITNLNSNNGKFNESIFDKLKSSTTEILDSHKKKLSLEKRNNKHTVSVIKNVNVVKKFRKFKIKRLILKFKRQLFRFFFFRYLKIFKLKFRRVKLFRRKKKRKYSRIFPFIRRYFFPELSHIVSYRSGFFSSKVLLYFSNPILSKVLLITTKKYKVFYKKNIQEFNLRLNKYILNFKQFNNLIDLKLRIYKLFKLLLVILQSFVNVTNKLIFNFAKSFTKIYKLLKKPRFIFLFRKKLRRFRRSIFFSTYIKLKRSGFFPYLFRLKHGRIFHFLNFFSEVYIKDFFKKRWIFFLNNIITRLFSPFKLTFKFIFLPSTVMTSQMLFNFFCKHLRKKRPLNRILNMILTEIKRQRLLIGFKILTAGRFTRKERALYKWIVHKQTPLSLYSSRIDYFSGFFKSRFGVSAFKIWIFKK